MSCLVKRSKAHLRQILRVVSETAELGIVSKLISDFFMMGVGGQVSGVGAEIEVRLFPRPLTPDAWPLLMGMVGIEPTLELI